MENNNKLLTLTASAVHETKRNGDYEIFIYQNETTNKEHIVLTKGLKKNKDVYCRFFSECTTGMILESSTCDCKEQLDFTFNFLNKIESAIIIFLREEGRGHGLTVKVKALANKNRGMDTFAA